MVIDDIELDAMCCGGDRFGHWFGRANTPMVGPLVEEPPSQSVGWRVPPRPPDHFLVGSLIVGPIGPSVEEFLSTP